MHEIEAVVFPQPGEVEMQRFQLPGCGPDFSQRSRPPLSGMFPHEKPPSLSQLI